VAPESGRALLQGSNSSFDEGLGDIELFRERRGRAHSLFPQRMLREGQVLGGEDLLAVSRAVLLVSSDQGDPTRFSSVDASTIKIICRPERILFPQSHVESDSGVSASDKCRRPVPHLEESVLQFQRASEGSWLEWYLT
jgi:hypothetical protein